jgi:hypothetical protein
MKMFWNLIQASLGYISSLITISGIPLSLFFQTWLGIAIIVLGLLLLVYWFFYVKPPMISDPPSNKDLKAYFRQLDKDFRAWKKRFVIDKKFKWNQMPIYAQEVNFYIPLLTQEVEEEEVLPDENNPSLRRGEVDILRQELKDNGEYAMLLTGQAGIGKTTSLRYLVYKDYRSYQPSLAIPVYLELKNASENQKLFDWIVSQLRIGRLARVAHLEELVEKWLEKGYIYLFLDGWNEISPATLEDKLIKEVEQFAQKYEQVFIIISVRDERQIFPHVPVFSLQNMDPAQVKKFIYNNTEASTEKELRQKIFERIEKQPRFLQFIQIPLYALMLIQIMRKRQEFPNSETEVIKNFIEALLKRDEQKGKLTERKLGINLETFKLLLAYLAYVCVFEKKQQNTALSVIEIQAILIRYEPNLASLDITIRLLQTALELGIIVLSKPEEKYSFVHQEYQSYFAGLGYSTFSQTK